MKSHNWEQRIGVENEEQKNKRIIRIKSTQQQNKIYELKMKSRNWEWKIGTQKIKSRNYERKNMNKNEGTKECMSFTSSSCMLTNLQTQSITKQM